MADKFEDLKVFDEAHKLTLLIYKFTKNFPKSETYGLTSQIRRSSTSVAANIVEGNSRGHKKEFLQFLTLLMDLWKKQSIIYYLQKIWVI